MSEMTVNGVAITKYRQWAYNLMVREAAGQQIDSVAAEFWREALGFPKDQDARKALEATKAQQAAA